MKKLLTLIAIAALAAGCCSKPATLSVEKFFENPTALVGQETTISGTIQTICPGTGQFVIGTADNPRQQLLVASACKTNNSIKGCIGKEINVKGTILETIVDEEFLVAFAEKANTGCPEMTANMLEAVAAFRERFEAEGQYAIYSITASEIICNGCCTKGKTACDKTKGSCCGEGKDKEQGCQSKKEAEKGGCKTSCGAEEKHEGCKHAG
jgi:hypothetical protein